MGFVTDGECIASVSELFDLFDGLSADADLAARLILAHAFR